MITGVEMGALELALTVFVLAVLSLLIGLGIYIANRKRPT